jgi:hypothetical protein
MATPTTTAKYTSKLMRGVAGSRHNQRREIYDKNVTKKERKMNKLRRERKMNKF